MQKNTQPDCHRTDRRSFLKQLGSFGLTLPLLRTAASGLSKPNLKGQLLYVGTYTTGTASKGIYIYQLNTQDGTLTSEKIIDGVTDPSFLTVDRRQRFLYAVNETDEFNGMKSGGVSAFAIDRRSGELTFLNKQPSMGGSPCHISVTGNGRFALVANYVAGNVAVLPIDANGRLSAAVQVIQHQGSGPVKARQGSAHAHWIDLDTKDRIAAVCDLGADKVFLYRFDNGSGKLIPNAAQPFFQTMPGAGPRHFVFHPNRRSAYVINELNATITVLAYDDDRGTLVEKQSISTLPANWTGENTCAELQLSPDGDFLYGSNRGHDSIVSYNIDRSSGKLSLIGHVPSGGKGPRNFIIDPTGKVLLVANQRSDNIVSFALEQKTGKPHPTGNEYKLPAPVCLKLILE